MPTLSDQEKADETVNLRVNLFHEMGSADITINDIDIAHRVPSRGKKDQPSIICKFTRRLAKYKVNVMENRKDTQNVKARELGFETDVDLSSLKLYDHLTPQTQKLYFEAKKYKQANNFAYCWVKNGIVQLRKTPSSTIIRMRSMEDLNALMTDNPLAASTMVPVYNQPQQDDSQPWYFPSHDSPSARGYPFTRGYGGGYRGGYRTRSTTKN